MFVSTTGQPINHTQGNTLRLHRLNEAIFGTGTGILITPQMIRKWNTTYLSSHVDEGVRQVRGVATGNSTAVFEEHYNLEVYSQLRDATEALRSAHHGGGKEIKKLSQLVGQQIADGLRQEAEDEAFVETARKVTVSKIDQSSKTTPIDEYTRTMLMDSINQISCSL